MMEKTGSTGMEGGSWSEILNRCGPGIEAKSDLAPERQVPEHTLKRAVPASGGRKRLRRFSRIAALFSVASIAVATFPDPIAVSVPSDAGDLIVSSTIEEQGGDARKQISVDSVPGRTTTTTASVTGLGGSRPDDSQSGGTEIAALDPAAGVGGPFEPAEFKAAEDGLVRGELQARLPRPGGSKDQSFSAADPAVVAALRELRLRQVFDETGMPQLLAQSSSLSMEDAQILIDRGKDMMALGDVVTARLVFQKVMDSGYAEGAFNLARSYDPKVLRTLPVRASLDGDPQKAKMLYALAEQTEKTISLSR